MKILMEGMSCSHSANHFTELLKETALTDIVVNLEKSL